MKTIDRIIIYGALALLLASAWAAAHQPKEPQPKVIIFVLQPKPTRP